MRILYRLRQFWRAVYAKIDPDELESALARLNPEQAALFLQLQPGEKAHALGMLRRLVEQGENQQDLLVAALLHDVGKLCYRLDPLERTMIVLVKAACPAALRRWGSLPPQGWMDLPGWRKAFVLSEHHARWGAEMARKAGASRLAETLIREHHHPRYDQAGSMENDLLNKLWTVDNSS